MFKTAHASFKLENLFTKNDYFKAYFTYDSCSDFDIHPKEGSLEQLGREKSNFLISYLPKEYGKNKKAKLIIETKDVMW